MNTFAETETLLKTAIIVYENGGVLPTISHTMFFNLISTCSRFFSGIAYFFRDEEKTSNNDTTYQSVILIPLKRKRLRIVDLAINTRSDI